MTQNFCRPVNREELYNLWHSSTRNAVERIFGILKKRFVILTHPPKYSMTIQAYISPTLCAIHNFIHVYDVDEIHEFDDDVQDLTPELENHGDLAHGPAGVAEKTWAGLKQDQIAQVMWESYQTALRSGRYEE